MWPQGDEHDVFLIDRAAAAHVPQDSDVREWALDKRVFISSVMAELGEERAAASISVMPVVASSTLASVRARATITPDRSTPTCRFFQPRLPRPPCFATAQSPGAHDREARAIDNEMQAGTRAGATQREVELLATPGARGVTGRGQGETQHPDVRRQAAFRLPQGPGEDEPARQRGFDGEIGIRPLPATGADAHGLPRGDRIRGQPHGDSASLDQRSVICRPMPDGVCCRVLWVHARRHVEIMPPRSPRWPGGRSWRTEGAGSVHQRPAFESAGPFPARAGMNRKLALDDPEFFDFIWDTVMDR